MPIIILRDVQADPKTLIAKREVVDGQQRIRTILSFIDPSCLPDFDPSQDDFTVRRSHNKEFAGKKFSAFDAEERRRIMDYQFSVHTFAADTDDREILQIFARMNATGLKLNAQEIRNSQFSGEFKTLAYSLAFQQLNRWRDWKVFSADHIARMLEAEMTSELMLLIMSGILQRKSTTLEKYYDDYDDVFPGSDQVAQRFRNTFDTIERNFTGEEIRRLFSNRSIFYALFATVYGVQYGLPTPGKKYLALPAMKPAPLKSAVIANIKTSADRIKNDTAPLKVLRAARGATAHEKSRRTLIGYLAGKDAPCHPQR